MAINCTNEGICHTCKQTGHRARDCTNIEESPRVDTRLCNNCYLPGHLAAECENDKACKNCRMTGHLARECENEPVCNLYNITGHVARECTKTEGVRENRGYGGGGRHGHRDVVCHSCSQVGHMSRDCMASGSPVLCHNCGGRGHKSFECPSARMERGGNHSYTWHLFHILIDTMRALISSGMFTTLTNLKTILGSTLLSKHKIDEVREQ